MPDKSAIFTFPSTHHALKAEQVLKSTPFKTTIIPVPRELTSLCGLAIKVDPEHRVAVEETLVACGVKIEGVFLLPHKKQSHMRV